MRVGQLAQAAGCHLETVRYYERIGLLPRPLRSGPGYRAYGPDDVERLRFIVRSRALGFGLEEIRGLLRLAASGDLPCDEADRLARAHLAQIEARRSQLDAMAAELRGLIDACHRDTTANCTILRALAARP